jgi:hypothetical protein
MRRMTMSGEFGHCPVCRRPIDAATPVDSAYFGRPAKSFMIHRGCKENAPVRIDYTPDGRGVLGPPHGSPEPSDAIVITTSPAVQAQLVDSLKTLAASSRLPDPAPVREQQGQRKPPAKKAAAAATE